LANDTIHRNGFRRTARAVQDYSFIRSAQPVSAHWTWTPNSTLRTICEGWCYTHLRPAVSHPNDNELPLRHHTPASRIPCYRALPNIKIPGFTELGALLSHISRKSGDPTKSMTSSDQVLYIYAAGIPSVRLEKSAGTLSATKPTYRGERPRYSFSNLESFLSGDPK